MSSKTSLWILFGPGALLASLVLLLYRTGMLLGRPVWLFGLTLSVFLACGIIYLTFKELLSRENAFLSQISQNKKEAEDIRAILEEAHTLYREKVDKLEETIATIEKEQKMHLSSKEENFKGLQENFEKVQEDSKQYKNHSHDLQTSLEDALDELRDIRQLQYILQEVGKTLPKDLPSQYRQLREQFDEKTLILDQTRRRLFLIEGQFLTLKKEQVMDKLGENPEDESLVQTLQGLLDENTYLEEEIFLLEALVSQSLKKTREKKTKKEEGKVLELQF
ncbi:MAG: hypothetical protein K1000chlam3_01497 [Chlamydiae bacterium]|nr:hypothetical protein [Chlamydiota bacterium]